MAGVTVRQLVTKWGFDVDDRPLRRMDARIKAVKNDIRGLTDLTRQTAIAIGSLGLGTGFFLKQAGDFEQIEVAFDVLLKGSENSKKALADLTEFAKKTPFSLTGVFKGAKQLLAYNIEAEKLIPTLKSLGNIAAGVGREKLPNLILAFGQVSTAGKLRGQEIRQFTEAGVPILQAVAKEMGVAKEKIMDLVSAGGVSFDVVDRALKNLTSGTGLFANLMERQSQTLLGTFEKLKDTMQILSITIGKAFIPEAKNLINEFATWLSLNEQLIKTQVQQFLGAAIEGFRTLSKVLVGVGRLMGAFVNLLGGAAKAAKILFLAISALIGLRLARFFGNVGIAAALLTRDLATLIIKSRAAAVALLGLKSMALLLPVALGLAFGGVLLLLEDIVAFMQGRESVVGGLIEDFNKNAPAFLNGLDGFADKVVGKAKDMIDKVVSLITDEEFASTREKLAEAVLTALDVVLQGSATLVSIGFRIGEAIVGGIVTVLKKKFPAITSFLGGLSVGSETDLEKKERQQARALIEKGKTTEELKSAGLSSKAIQKAKLEMFMEKGSITEFSAEEMELPIVKEALAKDPELAKLLEDRKITPDELETTFLDSLIAPFKELPIEKTAGLRKLISSQSQGSGDPITQNVNNVININGSNLSREELKGVAIEAISESMDRTNRETFRSVKSAVAE